MILGSFSLGLYFFCGYLLMISVEFFGWEIIGCWNVVDWRFVRWLAVVQTRINNLFDLDNLLRFLNYETRGSHFVHKKTGKTHLSIFLFSFLFLLLLLFFFCYWTRQIASTCCYCSRLFSVPPLKHFHLLRISIVNYSKRLWLHSSAPDSVGEFNGEFQSLDRETKILSSFFRDLAVVRFDVTKDIVLGLP